MIASQGRYFLGRIIGNLCTLIDLSWHMVLIYMRFISGWGYPDNVVFEDPEGLAARVFIHNYPQSLNSEQDITAILQIGTIWAIREPTYKYPCVGDASEPVISVDSPSDIVPIAFDDDVLRGVRWSPGTPLEIPRLLPSVEDYRFKGARQFKAQNWLAAAVCYTNGLRLDSNSSIMRLNRSEAYIRLGWYNSAFLDASQVIEDGIEDAQLFRKAVIRAAKASYHSKDYRRTIAYAQKLPNDKDCVEWIAKAKKRIHEQETGDYDWCSLYQESLAERSRPDVADFYGPVEVKEIDPIRGRGLHATRDIKIGELLVSFSTNLMQGRMG